MLIVVFCMNMTVYAADEEIELDSEEQIAYTEGDTLDEIDQYVDGIYNVNEYMRATMSGLIQLSQSGAKLQANYSTGYTSTVDVIGVKNVKLQYKGSLKIWYTVITIDDRHVNNDSIYAGAFTCNGVVGRTYRLKATHYIKLGSYTETRDNSTLELTF